MSVYNYPSFPLGMGNHDFGDFPVILKAGQQAPDGEAINASDGSKVKLSDFWKKGPMVIEFGSIT